MGDQTKVALITQCGSKISHMVAFRLAEQGFKLALIGQNKLLADELITRLAEVSSLSKSHHKDAFLSLLYEPSNYEHELDTLVEKFQAKFDRLDLLVINADHLGRELDVAHDEFADDVHEIMRNNLEVSTCLTRLLSKNLIAVGGVVINLAVAQLAIDYSPKHASDSTSIGYAITQSGLEMLTKVLANAFESTNVRVVGIASSGAPINETINATCDRTLAHNVHLDELVALVVFIASDNASFIHGTTFQASGHFGAGDHRPDPNYGRED